MRRRVLRGGLALVFVAAVVDGVFGARGIIENTAIEREHARLRTRIEELRTGNEELIGQIKRLREDPTAIEELAREELELMKDGELLIILRDAPESGPTAATGTAPATRTSTSTR